MLINSSFENMMATMCFSQPATASSASPPESTKRSLVSAEPPHPHNQEDPLLMEPSKKKVRFTEVKGCDPLAHCAGSSAHHHDDTDEQTQNPTTASSPKGIAELMERVHERAEQRKRTTLRSPPPPPSSEEVPKEEKQESSSSTCSDLGAMRRKLERMEHKIKESAKLELKLMNQSKKLRDKRAKLTRMYESMAHQLREMQRSRQPGAEIFQMGRLPPLMTKTRRVSGNVNGGRR